MHSAVVPVGIVVHFDFGNTRHIYARKSLRPCASSTSTRISYIFPLSSVCQNALMSHRHEYNPGTSSGETSKRESVGTAFPYRTVRTVDRGHHPSSPTQVSGFTADTSKRLLHHPASDKFIRPRLEKFFDSSQNWTLLLMFSQDIR